MEFPTDQPMPDLGLDEVAKVLMGLRLTDYEHSFRSLLSMLGVTDSPSLRQLATAVLLTLMQNSQIPWQVLSLTKDHLNALNDEEFTSSAIAIINGSTIVLPTNDQGIKSYDIGGNLREVTELPPAIFSLIWSTESCCKEIRRVMGW